MKIIVKKTTFFTKDNFYDNNSHFEKLLRSPTTVIIVLTASRLKSESSQSVNFI